MNVYLRTAAVIEMVFSKDEVSIIYPVILVLPSPVLTSPVLTSPVLTSPVLTSPVLPELLLWKLGWGYWLCLIPVTFAQYIQPLKVRCMAVHEPFKVSCGFGIVLPCTGPA